MKAPRSLDRFAVLTTLALCVSWGFNQTAAKIALADIPPVTQAALRSAIASVAVIAYAALARREALRLGREFWAGALNGIVFAAEFIVLFLALQRTTASSVSLFLYTAPFFFALGAVVFLPAERLARRQWAGMALAFVGVGLALFREGPGGSLIGDAMAIFAGALWGASTVLVKGTALGKADPITTLLYQTVIATLASALWAWGAGESFPRHIGALSAAALIFQSVFVVGITYPIWFWLLKIYRAGELSAFTFLTPVVGVAAGALWLGEPLSAGFLGAMALVAAGILIVNWPGNALILQAFSKAGRRDPG